MDGPGLAKRASAKFEDDPFELLLLLGRRARIMATAYARSVKTLLAVDAAVVLADGAIAPLANPPVADRRTAKVMVPCLLALALVLGREKVVDNRGRMLLEKGKLERVEIVLVAVGRDPEIECRGEESVKRGDAGQYDVGVRE